MKDVTLKIIGRQFDQDQQENSMEFVTEGKLYQKNGSIYLFYDESELSGFPGCRTSLKLTKDSVRMRRRGMGTGYEAELLFRKGDRITGDYETPYGTINMEVLTSDVKNNLAEDGTGNVDVDYMISLEGMAEGRNELRIEIE